VAESGLGTVGGDETAGRWRLPRSVWVILITGIALRVVVIALSSPEYNLPFWKSYGWPGDHGNFVQWGRQATSDDAGLLSMYTQPPQSEIKVLLSFGESFVHHGLGEIANYPPCGIYLVTLGGLLHRALDPELTANTAAARAAYAVFPATGDIVMALGVWRLALLLFGARAGRTALAVVFLAPPVWLDSCWWGQTDSWELAPAVWIVWAMVRCRWLAAGALWGLALSLKPQAVLLAPVWLFSWSATWTSAWRHRFGDRGRRDRRQIALGVGLAIVVLNVSALPFWFTSGDAWLRESYLRNLRDEAPHTTLKAFNLWYADLLLTYDTDVTRTIGGLRKDSWGKLLGVVGLLASAGLAWRSRLPVHHRCVLFNGLWLLAVVILPTRVHERYILMGVPFLIVAAVGIRRLWPGVVALLVVACFQLTVFHWLGLPADNWSRKLKAETMAFHADAVKQTPPAFRDQLPTLEQALALRFENFRKEHRKFAPCEWSLTILALLAVAATVLAATRSADLPQRPG